MPGSARRSPHLGMGLIDPKEATAVGYLAAGMLKALQQGDLENRFRALEAIEASKSKKSCSKVRSTGAAANDLRAVECAERISGSCPLSVDTRDLVQATRWKVAKRGLRCTDPFCDRFHQRIYICRFSEVVVNLIPNREERRFEVWITCQDKCRSFRLHPPHRAHNGKSVARLTNIQVRDEDIEFVRVD